MEEFKKWKFIIKIGNKEFYIDQFSGQLKLSRNSIVEFNNLCDYTVAEEYSYWAKEEGYRYGAIKALKIYELARNGITTGTANSSICIGDKSCLQVLRESVEVSNAILIQIQTIAYTLP